MQTFDGATYRSGAHACTYPLALKKGLEVFIHQFGQLNTIRILFHFLIMVLLWYFQSFVVYGTFKAESESGTLASSLTYVSLFDLKNKLRWFINSSELMRRFQQVYFVGTEPFCLIFYFSFSRKGWFECWCISFILLLTLNIVFRIQLGQGLEINYEGQAVKAPYLR